MIHQKNNRAGFLARRSARLRTLYGVFASKEPVFLYQMGKVGSTAIEASLRAAGVPVRHFHYLGGDFTEQLHLRRARIAWIKRAGAHLTGSLQRALLRMPNRPVRVITLVREPMARNIAAFFQALRHVVWEDRSLDTRRDVDPDIVLGRAFERLFRHDAPMRWIERELGGKLGVDAYARPFDHGRGWVHLEHGHIQVLLIRLEDLSRAWDAIGEFVGHPGVAPVRSNTGEQKWYGPLLREFRTTYVPTETLLDALYATPYMRHFYSADEIGAFRRRWMAGG